jgi:hypothetical protein
VEQIVFFRLPGPFTRLHSSKFAETLARVLSAANQFRGTSLINPITLPSESRKNVIHKS